MCYNQIRMNNRLKRGKKDIHKKTTEIMDPIWRQPYYCCHYTSPCAVCLVARLSAPITSNDSLKPLSNGGQPVVSRAFITQGTYFWPAMISTDARLAAARKKPSAVLGWQLTKLVRSVWGGMEGHGFNREGSFEESPCFSKGHFLK